MNFRNYLNENRINRKQVSKERIFKIVNPIQEQEDITVKISEINNGETTFNKLQNPQNKRCYLGEVSELPSASEFDEGTFIKKGQTVYIKQDGLWESLIEGNVVTREFVKYGVPGGGCGVSEVKQLINENALTKGTGEGYQGTFVGTFNTEVDLPAVANPGDFATTRNGVFYVWGA